jgi:hypothetical protein
MESRSKGISYQSALSSFGAVAGIYYGIKQKKSFWATVGYTLLFSLAGGAVGSFVDKTIDG